MYACGCQSHHLPQIIMPSDMYIFMAQDMVQGPGILQVHILWKYNPGIPYAIGDRACYPVIDQESHAAAPGMRFFPLPQVSPVRQG